MLYWIWEKIQLCLPLCVLLWMHKGKKGLPANIRLGSGRNLRAFMLTTKYGLLYTEEEYDKERLRKLKETSDRLAMVKADIDKELNGLSFEVREELFNGDK